MIMHSESHGSCRGMQLGQVYRMKNRFTGMTVNGHSSFLHGEGHDLDHIQQLLHRGVAIILQGKIVIVNCNKFTRSANWGDSVPNVAAATRGKRQQTVVTWRLLLLRIDICFCCIACYSEALRSSCWLLGLGERRLHDPTHSFSKDKLPYFIAIVILLLTWKWNFFAVLSRSLSLL